MVPLRYLRHSHKDQDDLARKFALHLKREEQRFIRGVHAELQSMREATEEQTCWMSVPATPAPSQKKSVASVPAPQDFCSGEQLKFAQSNTWLIAISWPDLDSAGCSQVQLLIVVIRGTFYALSCELPDRAIGYLDLLLRSHPTPTWIEFTAEVHEAIPGLMQWAASHGIASRSLGEEKNA